jgi:hypothetical protein
MSAAAIDTITRSGAVHLRHPIQIGWARRLRLQPQNSNNQ